MWWKGSEHFAGNSFVFLIRTVKNSEKNPPAFGSLDLNDSDADSIFFFFPQSADAARRE